MIRIQRTNLIKNPINFYMLTFVLHRTYCTCTSHHNFSFSNVDWQDMFLKRDQKYLKIHCNNLIITVLNDHELFPLFYDARCKAVMSNFISWWTENTFFLPFLFFQKCLSSSQKNSHHQATSAKRFLATCIII